MRETCCWCWDDVRCYKMYLICSMAKESFFYDFHQLSKWRQSKLASLYGYPTITLLCFLNELNECKQELVAGIPCINHISSVPPRSDKKLISWFYIISLNTERPFYYIYFFVHEIYFWLLPATCSPTIPFLSIQFGASCLK